MSSTSDFTRTAQDQVLEGIRQSQDAVVKVVEAWADAMNKSVPGVPAKAPLVGDVPKPEEIVETTFDFAQKLLDAQREFARNVLRAAAPAFRDGEGRQGDVA